MQGLSDVGAPLLARYDLEQVRSTVTREVIAARPPDLWRYHEVLPVRDPALVTTLGEGMTPLLALPSYGTAIGIPCGLLSLSDSGLVTLPVRACIVQPSLVYGADGASARVFKAMASLPVAVRLGDAPQLVAGAHPAHLPADLELLRGEVVHHV